MRIPPINIGKNTTGEINEVQVQAHTNDQQFTCAVCDVKTKTKGDLKKHTEDEHYTECNFCNKKFSKRSELENRKLKEHTLSCVFCGFKGNTEEEMEEHIKDKNTKPDKDNYFNCDDCSYKVLDKDAFWKHFKENHSTKVRKANKTDQEITIVDEDVARSGKAELKLLKSNFERLQQMYHESLDENNDYESRLMISEENYRKVKTENEVLKEKVDVLFKLGRSYINNATKDTKPEANSNNEDEIEVIEEEDDVESLKAWTKNKMRGFRRVDPTKPPVNKKSDSKAPKSPTKTYSSAATNSTANGTKLSHPNDVPNSAGNEADNSSVLKGQYCHYFVNKGYCRFEERTGTKCRFEHLQAPMCSFGTSCNRFKCMHSHPKVPSKQNNCNFLGQMMPPGT